MANTTSKAEKIIARILEKIGDKECIFRGTSRQYSGEPDGINSSLYRWVHRVASESNMEINLSYLPLEMEEEEVSMAKAHAKQHFSSSDLSDLQIVTALRHFGGNVNVIDFSTDLYVALFFACAGDKGEDGELIFVERRREMERPDIPYRELSSDPDRSIILIPPYNEVNHSRVVAQKSAFMYSPKGYLAREEYECYPIPKEVKQAIHVYLKRVHGIYREGIYNDLVGFIQMQTEKDRTEAVLHTYQGHAKIKSKEYQDGLDQGL